MIELLYDMSAKRVLYMPVCRCAFMIYLVLLVLCIDRPLCKSLGLCRLVHACRSRSMCCQCDDTEEWRMKKVCACCMSDVGIQTIT